MELRKSILRAVILRPVVGRRISRNISGLVAASRLLHEDSGGSARTQYSSPKHPGRSFGQQQGSG